MPRGVLFLAWAPFFSGAERALLLTLRSLDPVRYQPYVLTGTEGEFAAQVRTMGIPCKSFSLQPIDRRHPLAALRSVASVLKMAVRHRVALIHSNETASFQPGGYTARLLRIPSITHVRFPDTRVGYQWFFRTRFSRAIFVSRDLMDGAMREAPEIFGGRSETLYDCVEPQAPWSEHEATQCRLELGLPTEQTLVAITGQIAEVKGIWDFIEAARIVTSRSSLPFFVVLGDDLRGSGQMRRAMEERVAALGLTARFRFLGFRRDAPRIVQAFDVITVPSHVEPLGNATLEAMAAGRPVIGSRVGGIPEMVVDGETGLLVPPADPQSLAAAIDQIIRNPDLRSRMSAQARRRARDRFGIETHGRSLQALYDRVLASSSSVAA
jgi:glycosyltransferase involved in cell wall biosynthesis